MNPESELKPKVEKVENHNDLNSSISSRNMDGFNSSFSFKCTTRGKVQVEQKKMQTTIPSAAKLINVRYYV